MKKLNNNGFGHIEIFVVVAAVAVIGIVGSFVWQNSKSKDSSADNSYTIWKSQGYDVRACRHLWYDRKTAYNGVTAYVLATTPQARRDINKFVVKFVNSIDTSQIYDSREGARAGEIKEYKNPFGVNSAMASTVIKKNGSAISPYPAPVFNIKPCP